MPTERTYLISVHRRVFLTRVSTISPTKVKGSATCLLRGWCGQVQLIKWGYRWKTRNGKKAILGDLRFFFLVNEKKPRLYFRGVISTHVLVVWRLTIPPRVQFLLWLFPKNKLLTRNNLSIRKKVDDQSCLFCIYLETIHHFLTVIAK